MARRDKNNLGTKARLSFAVVYDSDITRQFGPKTDSDGNTLPPGTVQINSGGGLARPLSMHQYTVPLYGETVLTIPVTGIMGPGGSSVTRENDPVGLYYLPMLPDIHSNINHSILDNAFGGDGTLESALSQRNEGTYIQQPLTEDKQVTFRERFVAPIQPFQGDFITQDRFGSAIRMSGTHVLTTLTALHYSQARNALIL